MTQLLLVCALAVSLLPSEASSQAAQHPNSRAHILASAQVRDSFLISVGLPSNYGRDTTRRFPVLYVLDADKSFGIARDVADWLAWAGEAEPVIVVGIGYRAQWWEKRARDMTFSPDRGRLWGAFPTAGSGEAFLAFVTTELVPFVERTYRADSARRALAGLSFGGLFAIEALLRQPTFFSAMLIVAPAIAWDSSAVLDREAKLRSATTVQARVYTAIGEHDDPHVPEAWHTLVRRLRARQSAQSSLVSEVLPGESHISAWPVGITRGMRVLFPPPPARR